MEIKLLIKDKLIEESYLETLDKYWNEGKIMSESNKGEKNPMYGRKHTEETKRKQSEKHRLWWSNPENGNKMKGKNHPMFGKKRIFSEGHRKKLRESNKGEKNPIYGKRGKNAPMFGKHHSKETIKRISESRKEWWKNNPKSKEIYRQRMLNDGAAYVNSFIKNPSKPQVELFELVKELYPEAELNYPIIEFNRNIDVCIPHLKVAIEYDEPYWHDLEQDKLRQTELETLGYKFIRYERRIPTLEELESDINNIIVL